jgi:hypothetical protein
MITETRFTWAVEKWSFCVSVFGEVLMIGIGGMYEIIGDMYRFSRWERASTPETPENKLGK